jgi:hypothetical protein
MSVQVEAIICQRDYGKPLALLPELSHLPFYGYKSPILYPSNATELIYWHDLIARGLPLLYRMDDIVRLPGDALGGFIIVLRLSEVRSSGFLRTSSESHVYWVNEDYALALPMLEQIDDQVRALSSSGLTAQIDRLSKERDKLLRQVGHNVHSRWMEWELTEAKAREQARQLQSDARSQFERDMTAHTEPLVDDTVADARTVWERLRRGWW